MEVSYNFDMDEKTISNFESRIDKALDFSCNIQKYWLLAKVENKKQIQKLVFPDGLILDTKNRQYLTSNVNKLFVLSRSFTDECRGMKKGLSTQKSEKSSTLAFPDEISNFSFLNDFAKVVELIERFEKEGFIF